MTGFAIWAGEALVASSLLILFVLAIRRAVCRLFGPQVAYALWALPVLRMLLPPMPTLWNDAAGGAPLARAGETITYLVVTPAGAGGAGDAAGAGGPPLAAMLAIAWATGAAAFLLWQWRRHRRFCRQVLEHGSAIDRIDGVSIVASAAAPGPIAFGVLRRHVAVPRDFSERYDADERALAIAHELGHHQRGDLIANWIALLMLSLHWFNPLVWHAHRLFRSDQERANDARVLAGRGAYERHAYACAIVKAAHGGSLSVACHLQSVDDLKGRLKMLHMRISRGRLMAGIAAVTATALGALGLTASGTQAAESVREAAAAPLAALAPETTPATAATAAAGGMTQVVVMRDGKATVYRGREATAVLAAHPVAAPAAPLAPAAPAEPDAVSQPPAPAAPPAPASVVPHGMNRTLVVSGHCDVGAGSGAQMVAQDSGDGAERVIVCTDRVVREAMRGARLAAVDASRIRAEALREAMAEVRAARAEMAANRHIAAQARAEALRAMDETMRDIEDESEDE